MAQRIFLGLGSNLGDRIQQLRLAIKGMTDGGCKLVNASSAYATPPWGMIDQPVFYNAVIEVAFLGSPEDLLGLAMTVETQLGRIRSAHWGPRSIDIDILAFGDLHSLGQRLSIPHPLLHERAFVLVPWNEIAPEFWVPGRDTTVSALCASRPKDELRQIVMLDKLVDFPSDPR